MDLTTLPIFFFSFSLLYTTLYICLSLRVHSKRIHPRGAEGVSFLHCQKKILITDIWFDVSTSSDNIFFMIEITIELILYSMMLLLSSSTSMALHFCSILEFSNILTYSSYICRGWNCQFSCKIHQNKRSTLYCHAIHMQVFST